ncbi:MAG: addiction module protein [Desulfobacteraceae bacterium]|nr:addiction module protein [Desulfobacteraceae bacterium]
MENRLLEEALKMPPNERVALAEMILASIDYEDEEIREAWIAEVQERMIVVREGMRHALCAMRYALCAQSPASISISRQGNGSRT